MGLLGFSFCCLFCVASMAVLSAFRGFVVCFVFGFVVCGLLVWCGLPVVWLNCVVLHFRVRLVYLGFGAFVWGLVRFGCAFRF